MFKKKKYLDSIVRSLSILQSMIEFKGFIGLYDDHKIAEDFYCKLLNLIFDYNLVNKNHEIKNMEAIDLADSKERIAIQVTGTKNASQKIKNTIDLFIKNKLYNDYDSLWILFIGSEPEEIRTTYDTKEPFEFNKNNIWSIKKLIAEINKLDTEKLKNIAFYLREEIDEKCGEKKTFHKHFYICLIFFSIMLIGGISFCKSKACANVYFSKVLPYTDAGYYVSYEDLSNIARKNIEINKAFSILSFLRNKGKKKSTIEQVYCEIQQLELIEEAVIELDAEIINNTLKLYAINDGWGNSNSLKFEHALVYWQESGYNLDVITTNKHIIENQGVASAEAVLLAEYDLDGEKYKILFENHEDLSISIEAKVSDGKDFYFWNGYLNYDNGKFGIEYGGNEYDVPGITLFAVLDVDNRPSKIFFTGTNSTPIVDDTLRIETVIAPTKSCEVTCKNVFSINGKIQQTDSYSVRVMVPVFKDEAFGLTGDLTKELAQMDGFDTYLATRITQKYLYDPESIRELYQIMD